MEILMQLINRLWSLGKLSSLMLILMLTVSTVLAQNQTLGGTVIPNKAVAGYSFGGKEQAPANSNTVNSEIPKTCLLNVSPDGTNSKPAFFKEVLPGNTVYLAYSLTNKGNIANNFSLKAIRESGSSLGSSLSIILDANGNGKFDSGELEVSELNNIAIDETVNLLLKVVVSSNYAAHGSDFVNLVASCSSNSDYVDDNNVSEVAVPKGGISNFKKSAKPADGTSLLPGDDLVYSIQFNVNDRKLTNINISDKLNTWLADPEITVSVNGQAKTGAKFNADSREIKIHFDSLEAHSLVLITIKTSLKENTPGNELISNKANINFDGGSEQTNEVKHPVLAFCSVDISPSGTVAEPAYKSRALPSEKLVYAYEITNTANAQNTYNLGTNVLKQSDLEPKDIYIVIDANGNGKQDQDEKAVSSISLAQAETAKLLMIIDLPSDYDISGDIFASPVASCNGDLPVPDGKKGKDDDNVAQTTIPLGGFAAPAKSSSFDVSKPLYPNAKLTYSISFTANDRDLTNVLISDQLSEYFEAPTNISQGTITDSATGLSATALASYDSASHSISWSFAKVPATMTVTVSFDVVVRADIDITADAKITNIATIKADNVDPKPTNPVTHGLKPINIVIKKTVDKTKINIGEELTYSLVVSNPENSVELDKLIVVDDLPDVLEYVVDSAIVTMPDASEVAIEPTIEGQKLTWNLKGIAPKESLTIRFKVLVLPTAIDAKEIINLATATASDSSSTAESESESEVATVVQLGIFKAPAVLLGTVYTDVDDNNVFDKDTDYPQVAARIYLSDGRSVVTDQMGRYSFVNMEDGIEIVKIDNTTIPSRILKQTINESSRGQWIVRLEQGLITRLDIPLLDPKLDLSLSQTINLEMGPVSLTKTISRSNETAIVVLNLTSKQSLKALQLSDILPVGAKILSINPNTSNSLEFDFGDIEAGFSSIIEYKIELSDSLVGLYKAPAITWSVR